MTRNTINRARDLWVAGIPESTIAQQLDVDQTTVEQWRDDEDWQSLRTKLRELAATWVADETAKCDQLDAAIAWALREQLVDAIKTGEKTDAMSDARLLKMTAALERLRRIQEGIDRSSRDRLHRKEMSGDHAA